MSIFPETPRKQRNHREKFDPTEEHQQHENPFSGQGESDIRISRPRITDARADIAQGSKGSPQRGLEINARGEQDDCTHNEHQEIDENEGDVFIDATG